MSAATASSNETTFVTLRGEGVEVWRPVAAVALGGDVLRLEGASMPDDEHWEFRPGAVVHPGTRHMDDGTVRTADAAAGAAARRAS